MPEKSYCSTYAAVAWTTSDVIEHAEQKGIDMSEGDARFFLIEHSRAIQDLMVERGWQAIDDLLLQQGVAEREARLDTIKARLDAVREKHLPVDGEERRALADRLAAGMDPESWEDAREREGGHDSEPTSQ